MTSSAAPIPSASSAITIASVPFATPTASAAPRYAAASRSKPSTSGPKMKRPESSARANASFNSGMSGAYCALTSTCGIATASHRRRPPPHEQPRRRAEDRDRDRHVGVAEGVVEVLPARAEPPACAREGEAPQRGAERGPENVAAQRHLEDARRDRDERTGDRRDAPDEDGPVAPAVEPALGALEARGRKVEPTAAALQERPAAVEPDRPAGDTADQVADGPGDGDRQVRGQPALDL